MWADLLNLGVTVRPFDGVAPDAAMARSLFSATWGSTVKLLARELDMLDAQQIVLELDVRERDLRLDGLPRADARMGSPAVRLSCTTRWGPFQMEAAEYRHWQDNVRAVALSMEALRAVDRYGVSKRGEQYRGWRQIAASSTAPEDAITNTAQAREVLARETGLTDEQVKADLVGAIRTAVLKTHPDRPGGDEVRFRRVQRAKELLTNG